MQKNHCLAIIDKFLSKMESNWSDFRKRSLLTFTLTMSLSSAILNVEEKNKNSQLSPNSNYHWSVVIFAIIQILQVNFEISIVQLLLAFFSYFTVNQSIITREFKCKKTSSSLSKHWICVPALYCYL